MSPKTKSAITDALRAIEREREAPDTCLHYGINWRALKPARDGRLRTVCPHCGARISRSAFTTK